jgi:hypothetical protein
MNPKFACDCEDQLARMLYLCEQIDESSQRSAHARQFAEALLRESEALTGRLRAQLKPRARAGAK